MEIILQWLDDLDDVVFALVQTVEYLRWPCLQIGLAAACGLVVLQSADVLGGWAPALACVALGSVLSWVVAITIRELPRVAGTAARRAVSPNA